MPRPRAPKPSATDSTALKNPLPSGSDFDGKDIELFTLPNGSLGSYDRPLHWPPPGAALRVVPTVYKPVLPLEYQGRTNVFAVEGLRIRVNLTEIYKTGGDAANLLRHESQAMMDYWLDTKMADPCRPMWARMADLESGIFKSLTTVFADIINVGKNEYYARFRHWVDADEEPDLVIPSDHQQPNRDAALTLSYITTMKRIIKADPDRFAEMDENTTDERIWCHSLDNWARSYVAMKRFLFRRKNKDYGFYSVKRQGARKGIPRISQSAPPKDVQTQNPTEAHAANGPDIGSLSLERELSRDVSIPASTHGEYWRRFQALDMESQRQEASAHFHTVKKTLQRYLAREGRLEQSGYITSRLRPMSERAMANLDTWLSKVSAQTRIDPIATGSKLFDHRWHYTFYGDAKGASGRRGTEHDWTEPNPATGWTAEYIHNVFRTTLSTFTPRQWQTENAIDLFEKLRRPPHIALHGGVSGSGKTLTNAMLLYLLASTGTPSPTPVESRPLLYVCSPENVDAAYDTFVAAMPSSSSLQVIKLHGDRAASRNDRERNDTLHSLEELVVVVAGCQAVHRMVVITTYGTLRRILHAAPSAPSNPPATTWNLNWGTVVADDCERLTLDDASALEAVSKTSYTGICCCSADVVTADPKALLRYMQLAPGCRSPPPDATAIVSRYTEQCSQKQWDTAKCADVMNEIYDEFLCVEPPPSTYDSPGPGMGPVITQRVQTRSIALTYDQSIAYAEARGANSTHQLPGDQLEMATFDPRSRHLTTVRPNNAALSHVWEIQPRQPASNETAALEILAPELSQQTELDLQTIVQGHYRNAEDGIDGLAYLHSYANDSRNHPEPESRAAWLVWLAKSSPIIPVLLEEVRDLTSGGGGEDSEPSNVVIVARDELTQLLVLYALRMMGISVVSISTRQARKLQCELLSEFESLSSQSISEERPGSVLIVPYAYRHYNRYTRFCKVGILTHPPDTRSALENVLDYLSNPFDSKAWAFDVSIYTVNGTVSNRKWESVMVDSANYMLNMRQSPILSHLHGDVAELVAHEIVRCRFGLQNSLFLHSFKRCGRRNYLSTGGDDKIGSALSVFAQLLLDVLAADSEKDMWIGNYGSSLCGMGSRNMLALFCANERQVDGGSTGMVRKDGSADWEWIIDAAEEQIDERMVSPYALHVMGEACGDGCRQEEGVQETTGPEIPTKRRRIDEW
ncbi:hypothetical protein Hte_005877 [Hypoxylon texense]